LFSQFKINCRVFFVNPGSLGGGSFMSWDDCRDLERRGHDVASHTLTHGKLPKPLKGQDPARYRAWVFQELGEAKRLLERELKHPVTALAYPYGAYNPAVGQAALAAGYTEHYTVSDGVNGSASLDPLRLRRILLMGHPSQANFEKRLRLQPVTLPFKPLQEGALLYEHGAPLALTPLPEGLKVTLEGKPVQSLPGDL
jgi:peptidoglycan/xylan/chitin deacetylase (PgdA/CDA1 family)